MTALRMEDLGELLEQREGPCISLYMPTHRKRPDIQQDPIRFKNLLKRADEAARGLATRDASREALLEPARVLLGEPMFWDHASDGMAVFLAPGFSRIYRVPASFRERAIVSDAFHVKPLLPLLSGDGLFYVLALSRNHVRLLHGTRWSVGVLEPEGLPRSLRDALSTVAVPAKSSGSGLGTPMVKADLLRFFRMIDEEIDAYISDTGAPLVLAGIDRYFPIYSEANRYWNLLGEWIKGNPDDLSDAELHERAWKIVEPLFRKEQEAAEKRFSEGGAKSSSDLETVLRAAHHGRIEALFVARDEQRWGAYVPDGEGVVIQHESYEQGDQDLLDLAAAETLRQRGRVFAVETAEAVPAADSPLAAILRY